MKDAGWEVQPQQLLWTQYRILNIQSIALAAI